MIFLIIFLVYFLTISSMIACSKTTPKMLDIHVWEGYMPESVVDKFKQETGIKLNINYISETGIMLSLLKSGGKADIIMPTHSRVSQFYETGLIQPLDLENIFNYEKVSTSIREQHWVKWDGSQLGSGETYAIPYVFGTSGIVINTSKYINSIEDIGWEVLFDKELKGRVSSIDYIESLWLILDLNDIPREDLNTNTQATLEKIKPDAEALRENVLKFYKTNTEIMDLMKNEEVWVSFIWDGGGRKLVQSDPKFKYVLASSGGMAWADTFMIPKEAENPAGATLFIDFMLRPDIAAILTMESGFTTTVEGALDKIDDDNKDLYSLTKEELANLKWSPNLSQEAWSNVFEFWEELVTL
jgi:spermidine/putrescine transport system substrate-binding protein